MKSAPLADSQSRAFGLASFGLRSSRTAVLILSNWAFFAVSLVSSRLPASSHSVTPTLTLSFICCIARLCHTITTPFLRLPRTGQNSSASRRRQHGLSGGSASCLWLSLVTSRVSHFRLVQQTLPQSHTQRNLSLIRPSQPLSSAPAYHPLPPTPRHHSVMNAHELRDEMEGSVRDIQAACTAVTITYHTTQQPWMTHNTQATFTVHIKPPVHPTTPITTPPPSNPAPPLTIYAAAAMPHGYQRIHPAAGTDEHACVDERTVFVYDVDGVCYPTLNALLMRHCGQYRANKEDELTRKLQLLADVHGAEAERECEREEGGLVAFEENVEGDGEEESARG